jgi:hypothetical protein
MYGPLLLKKKTVARHASGLAGVDVPDRYGKSGGASLHNPAALVGVAPHSSHRFLYSRMPVILFSPSGKYARSLPNAAELVLQRSEKGL